LQSRLASAVVKIAATLCSAGSNPATSTNLKLNIMSENIKTKDLGIFRVNGIVYGTVSKDYIHDNEMTDTKINLINLEVI